jgi:hypothetical protein
MQQKIARIFSFILHPVFIPLFSAIVIFRLPLYPFTFYSPMALYVVLGLVFMFNVITPLFLIYLFKKAGFIASYSMENRRDRILPLFTFALMLYLTSMISKNWDLPPLWNVVLLFSAMLTLMSLLLTFFYKVSLHLTGWGGLAGLIFVLIARYQVPYLFVLSGVLLVSGISAWSRAVLEKHKASEMAAGFVLGIFVMVTGMYLLSIF